MQSEPKSLRVSSFLFSEGNFTDIGRTSRHELFLSLPAARQFLAVPVRICHAKLLKPLRWRTLLFPGPIKNEIDQLH
jgi:hypothetical protein